MCVYAWNSTKNPRGTHNPVPPPPLLLPKRCLCTPRAAGVRVVLTQKPLSLKLIPLNAIIYLCRSHIPRRRRRPPPSRGSSQIFCTTFISLMRYYSAAYVTGSWEKEFFPTRPPKLFNFYRLPIGNWPTDVKGSPQQLPRSKSPGIPRPISPFC